VIDSSPWRHADPAVDHVNAQHDGPAARSFIPDPHVYFSGLGELEGIAEQIHDDLPQSRWVGLNQSRNRAVERDSKPQPLFQCPGPHQGEDVGDQVGDVAVDPLDLHLQRLDL